VSSWVQNLSVADNILLAQRFKPGANESDLHGRAERLARRFGLGGLPQTRPMATPTQELVLSQWVRAFLPAPLRLLILEQPDSQAPENSLGALLEAINEARANGGTVLWIGSPNDSGLDLEQLVPSQTITLSDCGSPRSKE
jgi:ABC-type sugar transport system ATPase subunit